MLEKQLEQERTSNQSIIIELEQELKERSNKAVDLLESLCVTVQRDLSRLKEDFEDRIVKSSELKEAEKLNDVLKAKEPFEIVKFDFRKKLENSDEKYVHQNFGLLE